LKPRTAEFRKTASRTLRDPQIQRGLEAVYSNLHVGRQRQAAATPNWENQQDRGRAIKAHTIANLDHYLAMLADNVESNGGHVFFATDAEEGNRYLVDLALDRGVKSVIKSKSMVSEEMGLARELEGAGIKTLETDLGEYIIQLAGETPSHLIAPAIHKSSDQIATLLGVEAGEMSKSKSPEDLTRLARTQLRPHFERADMGITGVNFAVAETGSVVIVTNEGNGRLGTASPRIHVAIMGMEKVIPSVQDLALFLRILIRSATGQPISSYVNMVTGPRRPDEDDGPEEFHLVIVDNGRTRLLADPELRESLYCIRCGACLNSCPVYRKVGGHSYGYVYPGPIGAVITPILTGLREGKDLPFASTLCGACREACPVKIDIPRMLLNLRGRLADGSTTGTERISSRLERIIWSLWRLGMTNFPLYRVASKVGRYLLLPISRSGWVRRMVPPLSGWTLSRDFPLPARRPFNQRRKDLGKLGQEDNSYDDRVVR